MNEDLARLIVCEPTGRWAIALRRELEDPALRVYETRNLAECWAMLTDSPAGVVVVELTSAGVDDLLRRMGRLEFDFPRVRLAVVAARRWAEYEWLMREAGAVYFGCSPRQLGGLARLVARHLDQVSLPRQDLTQRLWAKLPWKPTKPPPRSP